MDSALTEFLGFLKEGLADTGPFTAKPYYDAPGDTLFYFARDEQSYAKRLNPLLTVFLATEDDSLVGFKIKGVQRILRRMERMGMERFVLDHQKENVHLTIFLEFALVAPPDDPATASFEGSIGQFADVVVDTRELQVT
ncbi:MAG TPA: hypothetical protein VMV69_16710 [Pirellulales bacterium]|nr:hypothetical protein [Pirellulales bacterium]